MLNTEVTPCFKLRKDRTQWVFKRFNDLFNNKTVLDVGCYEAPMRDFITGQKYTGIDFVGKPDIHLNLETVDRLPFSDNQFQTVICIEVLEHLNNCHDIAKDLFRVSSESVLISLPNCWRDARVKVERGSGTIAHYGLPKEKPLDRHKWFFNAEQAVSFFEAIKPENYSLTISFTEIKRPGIIRFARRLRYQSWKYLNRYAQTVWAKYTKLY